MQDGHLGKTKAAQIRIGHSTAHLQPISFYSYQAWSKARWFEETKSPRFSSWKPLNQLKPSGHHILSLHPKRIVWFILFDGLQATECSYITRFLPDPNMDECINTLGDSTLSITRDSNRGYWEVEINNGVKKKTKENLPNSRCRYIYHHECHVCPVIQLPNWTFGMQWLPTHCRNSRWQTCRWLELKGATAEFGSVEPSLSLSWNSDYLRGEDK